MMTTTEATSLLAACKPICQKFLTLNTNWEQNWAFELEKEDLPPLWGFYKVTKAGLGHDEQVRKAAGLNRSDIYLLNFILACQR
jgi:hypothetical protein